MNIKLNLKHFTLICVIVLAEFFLSCQLNDVDNYKDVSSSIKPKAFVYKDYTQKNHLLVQDIQLPDNFFRDEAVEAIVTYYRKLALKPKGSKVHLHNGTLKNNQTVHYAVLDIDVGPSDLQQCADAVIRLRAEYLFAKQQHHKIHFNFTSGDQCAWNKWKTGWRPQIKDNKVSWIQSQSADDSYTNFRKYLNTVFMYAGSASLSKEMLTIELEKMQIGDVFIQGGFPGHAVIVLDMAKNNNGEKIYLLAQSYMPAQDIHVLININDKNLSPWYALNNAEKIITPEWTFSKNDLKRFK